MTRVALLLPAETYRASDFLTAARNLGVDVVVVSDVPLVLDGIMGGHALTVDFADPATAADTIVAADADLALDAVVAADEAGVVAAALAAERLGLPHNPPAAAAATRDKVAQRRIFAAAEVPQPAFAVAGPEDDVASVAARVGWPVVVKAPCLTASRGVLRADDAASAAAAAAEVRAVLTGSGMTAAEPLLVESYAAGAEVAVEAVLSGPHRIEVLAVFDKPDAPAGPTFEETMLVTPSRLPAPALHSLQHAVAAAVAALGLAHGPVHAEARIGPDGRASILEVAARSIGGLCARTLRLGAGLTLEEVILANAAGLALTDIRREDAAAGVCMLAVPAPGTFRGVAGLQAALAVPGVTEVDVTVAPGTSVRPLPHGDRYLGFVFARAGEPQDVEAALREAVARLAIVID